MSTLNSNMRWIHLIKNGKKIHQGIIYEQPKIGYKFKLYLINGKTYTTSIIVRLQDNTFIDESGDAFSFLSDEERSKDINKAVSKLPIFTS